LRVRVRVGWVEFINDRLNGLLLDRIRQALLCLFNFRVVPVPGHCAKDAAQARADHRARPARVSDILPGYPYEEG
jgi:hypothetical protein